MRNNRDEVGLLGCQTFGTPWIKGKGQTRLYNYAPFALHCSYITVRTIYITYVVYYKRNTKRYDEYYATLR